MAQQNSLTFNQMLAQMGPAKAKKQQDAPGGRFSCKQLQPPDPQQATSMSVINAKEFFAPFLRKYHASEKKVEETIAGIARVYVSRGSLTARALQDAFSKATQLHSDYTDGRKIVSISIAAQVEIRLLVDVTEPADPVFLFLGRADDSKTFLRRFHAGFSALCSQNGHAKITEPLKTHLEAQRHYDFAVNNPRH